ncbi:MAG: riboflavin synthase [Flavobacteriales bacterium]
MFSGIVEEVGRVIAITHEKDNVHLDVSCSFLSELNIDQSIAHQGACLTVVEMNETCYRVTAIAETMRKTNLGLLQQGSAVNLERCMKIGDRIDGHMVQGHVDGMARCTNISDEQGSWRYAFEYDSEIDWYTVEKGSICVNGVSLTVVDAHRQGFSVCIIPYTYEHTTFQFMQVGDAVNLEFDMIGKYVHQFLKLSR